MVSMHDRSDEGSELDVVQFGRYDEDTIYVFYPKDATDKDTETMWIRSSKNGITWSTDQR